MATMASSLSFLLLSALSLLLLFASSAAARPGLHFHPCKTLLVSTYTLSFQPQNSGHRRPEILAIVSEVREFLPRSRPLLLHSGFLANRHHHPRVDQETLIRRPQFSLGSASFRDRSLDILNVLASLLFGAACGAATAGIMYFVWSLFSGRVEAYRSFDGFSDDEDDDDDDIFNPKKVHNNNNFKEVATVAVAAVPTAADSAETPLLKK